MGHLAKLLILQTPERMAAVDMKDLMREGNWSASFSSSLIQSSSPRVTYT